MYSEDEQYEPYQPQSPFSPSSGVGVLDRPHTETLPYPSQPPRYPSGPLPPLPEKPRRRGRGAATMLLSLVLALIFGVGLFSGWEFAHTTATTTQATTTASSSTSSTSATNTVEALQEAAIAKIKPSVVELTVTTVGGEQIGSGVIIDKNGDIVTNNHVINGAQTIQVTLSDGSKVTAQLVGTDSSNDLAVVRITPFTGMVVAQIADSSKLVVGQDVMAVGNPLGITETATAGMVSALNRSVTESTGVTISNAIQTDAAINPGSSGGPLINLQGQVVGLTTLTAVNTETNTPAAGMGFAISSHTIQTAVVQILQQGN